MRDIITFKDFEKIINALKAIAKKLKDSEIDNSSLSFPDSKIYSSEVCDRCELDLNNIRRTLPTQFTEVIPNAYEEIKIICKFFDSPTNMIDKELIILTCELLAEKWERALKELTLNQLTALAMSTNTTIITSEQDCNSCNMPDGCEYCN